MGETTAAERRSTMYGDRDLSSRSIFAGGFINYGFWRGIDLTGELTVDDRITSQQDLYRVTLRDLHVEPGHRLVEVGCGRGHGTALALAEFAPAAAIGVDLLPVQVERAQADNAAAVSAAAGRLSYVQGSAGELPLGDASVDRILSVEAIQHFPDLAAFATEARRVARPGARISVTSYFATSPDVGTVPLAELLGSFKDGIDRAHPVQEAADALTAAGFRDVRVTGIGEHVWRGFDRWLGQTEFRDTWARNWLVAHQRQLLDYYRVTGSVPA